ncbi:serine protease (plasmid) [Streptomyces longwoodensis]|uniref:VMAP-C domain-containing protein n=1 Tax=Streptomyces longwoodensis TaxID=68231 RepID=UPI002F915BE5|nr:serine protease [Streptomyces longwoodensis]
MDERRLALIHGGTLDVRHSVGTGYLIAPRLVLTARHVLVNRATEEPWPEIRVRVGHPRCGEAPSVRAELLWHHPQGLDVALLRVEETADLEGSVRWGRPVGRAPLRYEGLGFPRATAGSTRDPEHLRGVLAPLSGSGKYYVLDQEPAPAVGTDGEKAWGGASGAAVFCDNHLVGVVVHDDRFFANRRLHAVPTRAFVEDSGFAAHLAGHPEGPPRLIDIGAAPPKAGPADACSPTARELATLLRPLLADPVTRWPHARELARELGYETALYEPTVPDLAALLATHPRALATLGSSLAASCTDERARANLTDLLMRARVLDGVSLLSPHEYDGLLDLLRSVCKEHPALLPRAAREALRYTVLPESLTRPAVSEQDLGGLVEELEVLSDSERVPEGTPSVPALLRLVEYVAAASAFEVAARLRSWSEETARRLGIHSVALRERRVDASAWAQRPTSPVSRVVMELERDDSTGEELYRCRILLAGDDGSQTVLHDARTVPKTPEEAARRLRDAVAATAAEPGQGDHVPWVSVVVDRTELHLAVDEWQPDAADNFMPGQPLGAEYRVTLSCRDMSEYRPQRAQDQRRRWRSGPAQALVTDPACRNGNQLRHLLQGEHRDAAQVVLNGPAEERATWLQMCLAMGVPVVLWDRAAASYEDSERLHELRPTGRPDDLPERVRAFRSSSFAYPGERAARPSLVWEQDGRYPAPEPLHFNDPRKGTHAP